MGGSKIAFESKVACSCFFFSSNVAFPRQVRPLSDIRHIDIFLQNSKKFDLSTCLDVRQHCILPALNLTKYWLTDRYDDLFISLSLLMFCLINTNRLSLNYFEITAHKIQSLLCNYILLHFYLHLACSLLLFLFLTLITTPCQSNNSLLSLPLSFFLTNLKDFYLNGFSFIIIIIHSFFLSVSTTTLLVFM